MEKLERDLGNDAVVVETVEGKNPSLLDYVYYASKQRDSERAQDMKRFAPNINSHG